MSALSDELLQQIANGSGRCYNHEGKAMAAELITRRTAERETAAKAKALSVAQSGLGAGWGLPVPPAQSPAPTTPDPGIPFYP